jgi:adenylylsulfate kinase
MSEQKATNITWHEGEVKKSDREQLMNQRGVILWFTGLSGSGKSTVAHRLEQKLFQRRHLTYVLDGDNVRHGLNKNLGFSPEDRKENIRRVGEVAKLFSDAGIITMAAFISPYRQDRQNVRALVEEGDFVEIHVKVPLEVAEERDPKGLYEKARSGEIDNFTGIDAPYEAPEDPEIIIETGEAELEENVQTIIEYLEEQEIISRIKSED